MSSTRLDIKEPRTEEPRTEEPRTEEPKNQRTKEDFWLLELWFLEFSFAAGFGFISLGWGDGEDVVFVGDEENVVGDDGRGVDRVAHVDFGDGVVLFLGEIKDRDVAVLVADIDLVADDHGGAPGGGEHVVGPIFLAGLGIDAVEEATEVRNEQEI